MSFSPDDYLIVWNCLHANGSRRWCQVMYSVSVIWTHREYAYKKFPRNWDEVAIIFVSYSSLPVDKKV